MEGKIRATLKSYKTKPGQESKQFSATIECWVTKRKKKMHKSAIIIVPTKENNNKQNQKNMLIYAI